MRNRLYFAIAAALFAPLFSGCDDQSSGPVAQTSCPANAALIAVNDGYLETICGCAEAAPAYFAPGERLLCTVTSGTTVLFQYMDTRASHQIIPTGTPAFPPSPLSNPADQSAMIRVHAVKLDTTGTYSFEDAFDTALSGDIDVL